MNPDLKPEERELYKLVHYFKKRAEVLIIENKLDDEYKQMLDTCDKLTAQLDQHALQRSAIMAEREQLRNIIKDNARCPKCESNAQIKVIGTDTNEQGWKSNKYKCRKCNITFVWVAPNNPWDMIPYVEQFISQMENKLQNEDMEGDLKQQTLSTLDGMKNNLNTIKPVVENSDREMQALMERDVQMGELVRKFKKHLMIEKIRLEE
ncbi:MAG: hypothetical protein JNL60_08015 [Bacteroidia bacterium]|nr:hypothetical protein [Bacteroidia bacterium]